MPYIMYGRVLCSCRMHSASGLDDRVAQKDRFKEGRKYAGLSLWPCKPPDGLLTY
jgi:hypothetical protein